MNSIKDEYVITVWKDLQTPERRENTTKSAIFFSEMSSESLFCYSKYFIRTVQCESSIDVSTDIVEYNPDGTDYL